MMIFSTKGPILLSNYQWLLSGGCALIYKILSICLLRCSHAQLASVCYGVPQNSMFCSFSFITSIYLLFLGLLQRRLGFSFYFYTDNTQIYMSCSPLFFHFVMSLWLFSNILKITHKKTKVLLVGFPVVVAQCRTIALILNLDGSIITSSDCVENLGVNLANSISFKGHIKYVSKL